MTDFKNIVLQKLGFGDNIALSVKITVCDLQGVHIEGHRGVLSYTPDCICLLLKKKKLEILGKGLRISEISTDEAYVNGIFVSMAVLDV